MIRRVGGRDRRVEHVDRIQHYDEQLKMAASFSKVSRDLTGKIRLVT